MTHERRRSARAKLCYCLRLFRSPGAEAVRATTTNLDSLGFHCRSEEPFSPGDRLGCELFIPRRGAGGPEPDLILKSRVEVVRVEISGIDPAFGIACRFEIV